MRLGLCLATAAVFFSQPVQAQSVTRSPAEIQAQSLFEAGLDAAEAEHWGEAVDLFRRSLQLVERPNTLFNLGVALISAGKPVEAKAVLERYLRVSSIEQDRQAAARIHLAEAEHAIGHLQLAVEPANAEVRIDGQVVVPGLVDLDPGEHRLSVRRARYESLEENITIGAAETTVWTGRLRSALDAATPAAPTDLRNTSPAEPLSDSGSVFSKPVFWIVTAAVVVVAGVGIGLGVGLSDSGKKIEAGTQGTIEGLHTVGMSW